MYPDVINRDQLKSILLRESNEKGWSEVKDLTVESKEEHSYSLVPGLTPVVSVKNVRTVLLGKPYTQCIEDISYTTQGCLYGKLLDRIVRMCQCYPSYAEDGKKLKKKFSTVDECNFYLHATCVSFVKEQFDQTEVTCEPACYQDSIHQESIPGLSKN
ncbi:Oidioi.mRNA.OKI2018_I69.XSR.g14078.t1.cds [Oikopleura dioica]|uniref:Oidioi.mRNA.OKI2018_I69.XSR.g14078.t1.cds n=1 Tax=Oikopleura dioica TaxID=34765 RepID=A0ABN7SCN4_OIKDI|nr:Oidioi.mRNA.OKI2018_I69.XSR.g14078.t1.cds [Oikopleura dioica]